MPEETKMPEEMQLPDEETPATSQTISQAQRRCRGEFQFVYQRPGGNPDPQELVAFRLFPSRRAHLPLASASLPSAPGRLRARMAMIERGAED